MTADDDDRHLRVPPTGMALDVVAGTPVTWMEIPRGGVGGAMAVDAVVKAVTAKRVRIEVQHPDGSYSEHLVTRANLRIARTGHPLLVERSRERIVRLRITKLSAALACFSFPGGDEATLQRALLRALATEAFAKLELGAVDSEVIADRGRYDIMLKDDIATIVLELKVKGSAAAVERQAQRYALTPEVNGVVVVTTSNRLGAQLKPGELGLKPFGVVIVRTYV